MKSEINIKSHILSANRPKIMLKALYFCLCAICLCSCSQDKNNINDNLGEVYSVSSSWETTFEVVSRDETTSKLNNEVTSFQSTNENDNNIIQFLNEFEWRIFNYAIFCDIDLDGNIELLLARGGGRSFSTEIFYIYKLNDEIPTLYGRIDLESSQSRYTENTICGGKLHRYYDSEKGVYVIIGDATQWDDGSFGYIQYYVLENILYSDKIESRTLNEFSGTRCFPAKYIREETDYSNECDFVYYNGIFDLNGTEKFADISDITEKYEFVDTVDLEILEKHEDIYEIAALISEYSGYENTNKVLAPDKKYIGITGMGNHEICTNDTEVHIEIKDIDELDWNKICKIEDLHTFVLDYWGEDEIDLDLSPLKKYNNLTVISLRDNISKNTKRQISEFSNLEYVNMWDIMISSEEDFEYVKDLPKLRYIAIASDNDDPDYFKFLYDNNSIKWIRFDNSVTNEQIKQVVDNMPNLEAVTFGFSEV